MTLPSPHQFSRCWPWSCWHLTLALLFLQRHERWREEEVGHWSKSKMHKLRMLTPWPLLFCFHPAVAYFILLFRYQARWTCTEWTCFHPSPWVFAGTMLCRQVDSHNSTPQDWSMYDIQSWRAKWWVLKMHKWVETVSLWWHLMAFVVMIRPCFCWKKPRSWANLALCILCYTCFPWHSSKKRYCLIHVAILHLSSSAALYSRTLLDQGACCNDGWGVPFPARLPLLDVQLCSSNKQFCSCKTSILFKSKQTFLYAYQASEIFEVAGWCLSWPPQESRCAAWPIELVCSKFQGHDFLAEILYKCIFYAIISIINKIDNCRLIGTPKHFLYSKTAWDFFSRFLGPKLFRFPWLMRLMVDALRSAQVWSQLGPQRDWAILFSLFLMFVYSIYHHLLLLNPVLF